MTTKQITKWKELLDRVDSNQSFLKSLNYEHRGKMNATRSRTRQVPQQAYMPEGKDVLVEEEEVEQI